jgi:hypothetical protein
MYIKRVTLESLRGFENLDLKFERPGQGYAGWWVITGDNGSGKTALLKSIAMALVGPDAIRSLQPSFRGWIHRDKSEAVVSAELVASERDKFAVGRPAAKPFWAVMRLLKNGGPDISLKVGNKGGGKGPTNGPWAENPIGWFSLGYGPFRRLYGASPEAQRVMSGPSRIARYATMFREDATLGECELWLKELHFKKLEGHQREDEILKKVLSVLNDDFLENDLRVERVDSEGLWLRQPNDLVLPLAEMSEGYRAALAMLVDLLRHLVQVYGHEQLIEETDGRLVISYPGVVLIDEVDAHLHPDWQRKIGFWLKERFPNCQFIVTTHSELVPPAADQDGIFHLPPPGSDEEAIQIKGEDYNEIIKGRADEVLRSPAFNLLHTISPRAVEARRRYAQLRAKGCANGLSPTEKNLMKQLSMFADDDDEEEGDEP